MNTRAPAVLVCTLLIALTDGSAAGQAITAPKTVFVIVMENHNWSEIVNNAQAPFINSLLSSGAHAEAYDTPPGNHPSAPNYWWMEAGQNFGLAGQSTYSPALYHQSTTNHLVTELKNAGVSWKTYQENIGGTTCPLVDQGLYVTRHNPFVFFDDVTNVNDPSSAYCIAHVRPYAELSADLSRDTIAAYNFITPNVCNDMHGGSGCPGSDDIRSGDNWLAAALPPLIDYANANDGVIFIVWDEPVGGSTLIPFVAIGPQVKPGYASSVRFTHSSLTKTVEEIFGLPILPTVSSANDLSDLFQPGAF
jgi:phosphatidylinositol-3-phosphatase